MGFKLDSANGTWGVDVDSTISKIANIEGWQKYAVATANILYIVDNTNRTW
ncbi:hypothetical protein OK016_29225 [Vibrio chagasii]|nr:hypothetical protein [Vibrio chagasii]